ncbi:hypothetical protein KAX75_05780 [candidate division WOR-3 bacterium]|nr:hypothetical protein [candidate division WOR-3 bacterium]
MKRLFTLTSFLSLQGRGSVRYEIFYIGDEYFGFAQHELTFNSFEEFRNFFYEKDTGIYVRKTVELAVTI